MREVEDVAELGEGEVEAEGEVQGDHDDHGDGCAPGAVGGDEQETEDDEAGGVGEGGIGDVALTVAGGKKVAEGDG